MPPLGLGQTPEGWAVATDYETAEGLTSQFAVEAVRLRQLHPEAILEQEHEGILMDMEAFR